MRVQRKFIGQSSVILYGVIDTGVEYVSHANAAGDGVVRTPVYHCELPSRWGLKGAKDLGGGAAMGLGQ